MSEEWKESLPAEMREKPMVANAKSLEEFVNNGLGLESKMGTSLSMPNDSWTDPEREQWRDKVMKYDDKIGTIDNKVDILQKWGMPDDATGYQVDPDREYNLSDEQILEIKGNAFNVAMTQEQFYAQLHSTDDKILALGESNKTALEADRDTIFQEWGADKPAQLDNIVAYLELMGADEGMTTAVRENMSASQLRMFAKAAQSVKGESIQSQKDVSAQKSTMTPAEANEKINAIMADPAFRNKMDPQQPELQRRYLRLVNMAAGRPPETGLTA